MSGKMAQQSSNMLNHFQQYIQAHAKQDVWTGCLHLWTESSEHSATV
jgi:hypothetical protein